MVLETKSLMFQSNIINEEEQNIIMNWIPKKIISTKLIFDTSRDGDSIDAFKNKCEGICPTLVIVKTNTGIVFGGYATSAWKKEGPIIDYNSFIFSLDPPKKYNVIDPANALCGYRYNDILFQFGCCCFRIAPNCTKYNNSYISGRHYENGFKALIKGDGHFTVSRMEIFILNY